MVFASPIFLFAFLPAALLLCYLAGATRKPDARNAALFLFSMLFYAWGEPVYVLVMAVSIAVNHLFAQRVRTSRAAYAAGIAFNLALLGTFKYLDMLIESANWALKLNLPLSGIALPIGISFYTFQTMSYLIDVRRGDVDAQRNPLRFATYVVMFPQLIAGPIVRYVDISRELGAVDIGMDSAAAGVRRFCVGLAKKALIANSAAEIADAAFGAHAQLSFDAAWLGVIAYAVQIYFDFSGYSDMAIGMGRMLGFRFLENFDYPYIARSVREFWRRWHISLSTWFRDYLYIPLGGSRKGSLRTARNLVIVFALCGLWHGASWSFVIWGLWHGIFLCFERIPAVKRALSGALGGIARVYTLLVVLIGWVLFRADTLGQAMEYLQRMFSLNFGAGMDAGTLLDWRKGVLLVIGILFCAKWRRPRAGAWTDVAYTIASFALLILSMLSLAGGTYNPFIYFRF
ncbi:MAG: MBOAT family O-acyltransferase [Christensenellales bacterium]|jgi:alginate O-acetyltransferase complex protein AlgI